MIGGNRHLLDGDISGLLEDSPEPIAPWAVTRVGQHSLERGQNWTVDLKEDILYNVGSFLKLVTIDAILVHF